MRASLQGAQHDFYALALDEVVPESHLVRKTDAT